MALLAGIALSPELLSLYGPYSKSRDLVSVLGVPSSWFPPSHPLPSSHGQMCLHHTATPKVAAYCVLLPPLLILIP